MGRHDIDRPRPSPKEWIHRMIVITANIQNLPNLTDHQVREDIATIKYSPEPGRDPRFVLWQEIEEARDHAAIEQVMGDKRFRHLFPHQHIPITVPKPWRPLERRAVQTHKGIRLITPHRMITSTVVRNPRRPRLDPIAFVNTHFISGVRDKQALLHGTRKRLWAKHWRALQAEVQLYQARGLTVVLGGDMNHTHVPKLAPTMIWVAGQGRIDKLAVIPGSVHVDLEDTGRLKLNSDHDATWARLGLSKA